MTSTAKTSTTSGIGRTEFRLQTKYLSLTWPQCQTSKETVLRRIRETFGDNLEFAVVCEETHKDGTPHLHAAVSLKSKNKKRGSLWLDNLAGKHGHYKACSKGTPHQKTGIKGWVDYVCKDNNYVSWGIDVPAYLLAAKRKRSTSSEIAAWHLKAGKSLHALNEEMPGFVMMNLQKLRNYQTQLAAWAQSPTLVWAKLPPPQLQAVGNTLTTRSPGIIALATWLNENMGTPRVLRQKQLLLSSPPGVGKTTLVQKLREYFHVYSHVGGKWFDGYDDSIHEIIVFDEFCGNVPMTIMNKVLDGQTCTLEVKGSSVPKTKMLPCIVLTNYEDFELYTGEKVAQGSRDAFLDRFTYIRLGRNDHPYDLFPLFSTEAKPPLPLPTQAPPQEEVPSAAPAEVTPQVTVDLTAHYEDPLYFVREQMETPPSEDPGYTCFFGNYHYDGGECGCLTNSDAELSDNELWEKYHE